MRIAHLRRLLYLALLAVSVALHPLAQAQDLLGPERQVAQAGGILKVYSSVKGARVFLNDAEIGRTPVIRLLTPGSYKVRLEAPGYDRYEETIEILPNKAMTLNPELIKVVGAIEIAANVDDAEVLLDGREMGRTPGAVLEDLPGATYQIEVRKPGYAPYTGPVTVRPNMRIKLRVELLPNAALVRFASTPEGARVFLDDKPVGQTPLTLETVDPGKHAVRFELSGHGTFYRSFQSAVGDTLDIRAILDTKAGGLKVKTRAPGASVFLEGNNLGKSPIELERQIQPGQYSLRIVRPGFADYIQPVLIEPDHTVKVTADLISLERKPGQSTRVSSDTPITRKWWFWTAVGGVLLAAGGTTAALSGGEVAPLPAGDVSVTLP